MKIILSPQRRDETLTVYKMGSVLTVNGEVFDFSRMADGDTLPRSAFHSLWLSEAGAVEVVDGELSVTLLFPIPRNYSQEQAFPVPLLDVPDGYVVFPQPVPSEDTPVYETPEFPPIDTVPGVINWSLLVTAAMKAAAANADHLAAMKAELAARNAQATLQIARVMDRIETIGYGIEFGEATPEDEAEQAALLPVLASWKAYKFALGKVTKQPTWPAAPVWPVAPPVPVIVASPESKPQDQV